MVGNDADVGSDAVQLWIIFNEMLVLTGRIVFLPMSKRSHPGGQVCNLIPWGFCREGSH